MIGTGPGARSMKIPLKPFTLVAATTRAGLLTAPAAQPLRHRPPPRLLRSRPTSSSSSAGRRGCSDVPHRAPKERSEIAAPQPRHAAHRQPPAAPRARLRPGPRRRASSTASWPATRSTLLEVDDHGFDEVDRKLLLTIIDKFGGGPVGVAALAAAISEEPDAIEDIYEPYLLQIGFLDRTPRGRTATRRAYQHFGRTPAERDPGQTKLF